MTEIMIVNSANNIVWSINLEVFEIIKNEILNDTTEVLEADPAVKLQNTVSEDFALKAIGMVLNKEKFKDVND